MTQILLPAPAGDLYGYISTSGAWRLEAQYDNASRFLNGYAQIAKDGQIGCIASDGRRVLNEPYAEIRPFLEGYFCASFVGEAGEAEWFVLDAEGQRLAGPFEWCALFSEGYLRVKRGKSWDYLSRELKVVLSLEADWAGDVLNSRIRVIEVGGDMLTRFVDIEGRTQIKPASGDFEDFCEGIATRRVHPELWEIWNGAGQRIAELPLSEMGSFSEGLCSAKALGKWGFLDREGRWAIDPRFDEVAEFSDGLAAVRIGSGWSFIEPSGASSIEGPFDKVEDFIEGYALVLSGRRRAYLDKLGRRIWEES